MNRFGASVQHLRKLKGRESFEGLEAFGEVVGGDEGSEVGT